MELIVSCACCEMEFDGLDRCLILFSSSNTATADLDLSPLPNATGSRAVAGPVQKVSEVGVIGKPHAAPRRDHI